MKIRKIIFKRFAEFVFVLSVELASAVLLGQMTGGHIFYEIVALIAATLIFDALAQKYEDQSCNSKKSPKKPKRQGGQRQSTTTKRKSRSPLTFLMRDKYRFRH